MNRALANSARTRDELPRLERELEAAIPGALAALDARAEAYRRTPNPQTNETVKAAQRWLIESAVGEPRSIYRAYWTSLTPDRTVEVRRAVWDTAEAVLQGYRGLNPPKHSCASLASITKTQVRERLRDSWRSDRWLPGLSWDEHQAKNKAARRRSAEVVVAEAADAMREDAAIHQELHRTEQQVADESDETRGTPGNHKDERGRHHVVGVIADGHGVNIERGRPAKPYWHNARVPLCAVCHRPRGENEEFCSAACADRAAGLGEQSMQDQAEKARRQWWKGGHRTSLLSDEMRNAIREAELAKRATGESLSPLERAVWDRRDYGYGSTSRAVEEIRALGFDLSEANYRQIRSRLRIAKARRSGTEPDRPPEAA